MQRNRRTDSEMSDTNQIPITKPSDKPILINSDSDVEEQQQSSSKQQVITIESDSDSEPEVMDHLSKSNYSKKVNADSEVQLISTTQKQSTVQSKSVCFGMFYTPITDLNHTNTEFYTHSQTGQYSVIVGKKIIPSYDYPILVLSAPQTKQTLCYMNHDICRILNPLLPFLRFSCYLLLGLQDTTPYLKVILYGELSHGGPIGKHLLSHQVKLIPPDVQPSFPYNNPQLSTTHAGHLTPVHYDPRTSSSNNDNRGDIIKQHIEKLYASFTAPVNLDELEQDSRLESKLFKYQRQALFWMMQREHDSADGTVLFWRQEGLAWINTLTDSRQSNKPDSVKGGILADDMGLGKTIQIISIILKGEPINQTTGKFQSSRDVPLVRDPFGFVPDNQLPNSEPKYRPKKLLPSKSTLIVCPLSTVHNWEDQILSHSKPDTLRVLIYHGPNRTNDSSVLAKYDVVITTYNIIGTGLAKSASALHEVHWYRIVLDEAHIIKTASTVQARAAFAFQADVKWCLTGTPIQNRVDDLYSLIKFIGVHPLDKRGQWTSHITKPIQQHQQRSRFDNAFRNLQTLMKGITLRRTKNDMVDGKPLISLPPRTEQTILLDLNNKERVMYDKIHSFGRKVFEGLRQKGNISNRFFQILNAILLMRQACLHPKLFNFDESAMLRDIDISNAEVITDTKAKEIFKILKDSEEDKCVNCALTIEGPMINMLPCQHLICNGCIQGQAPAMETTSSKLSASILCSFCQQTFGNSELIEFNDDVDQIDDTIDLTSIEDDKSSTKIEALIEDLNFVRLNDLQNGTAQTKSVVFSQFTKLLSLLEKPLKDHGFKMVRLDGSMSRIQRSQAQSEFKSNPEVTIFLISIKSGGVGLNLVSGTRVYLMEPYWNPAVEQQAIDRVHRLGQTKPVTTVRFIVKNSIEENMQKRQRYKTALAQKAFNEDGSGSVSDGSATNSNAGGKKRRREENKKHKEALQLEKLESLSILFQ
ncbi:SNF2 family N-terminal domain-containing protein [Globomyces pollinis-pini]|nr:SNF2 family N-terminal domain-containing protein [Globomyces pollinis-pini]